MSALKGAPAVTDPYRPPAGAPPSDDIELVAKRREILPTVNASESTNRDIDAVKRAQQVDTTCRMIEALEHHCRETSSSGSESSTGSIKKENLAHDNASQL